MTQHPSGAPGPRQGLNLRLPLHDSMGHQHTVVLSSGLQLLTCSRGLMFLWDLSDGSCLMRGMTRLRLSNDRLRCAMPIEPVGESERATWIESSGVIDQARARASTILAAQRSPGNDGV